MPSLETKFSHSWVDQKDSGPAVGGDLKASYHVSRTQKGISSLLQFLISTKCLMVNGISFYLRYKCYLKESVNIFLITKGSDEGWIKIPV